MTHANYSVSGPSRESAIPIDAYRSGNAIERRHLYSIAEQVAQVMKFRGHNVLEIGVGNGAAAAMMKSLGRRVTTVDINSALDPDICADFRALDWDSMGTFDVTLCCEVLEHLPFHDFHASIQQFRRASPILVLSLPCVRRFFGVAGLISLSPIYKQYKAVGVRLPIGRGVPPYHCWEIDSCSATRMMRVLGVVKSSFSEVTTYPSPVNPYHQFFLCRA
jgi:SAM-dependent methyltransferase